MTRDELRALFTRAIADIRLNMARRSPQYKQGATDAVAVFEKALAAVLEDERTGE